MKQVRNQGFAIVETLLVVIILGLIGFTGWYVWHSKNAADKTLNTTNSSDGPLKLHKVVTLKESGVLKVDSWGFSLKVPGNQHYMYKLYEPPEYEMVLLTTVELLKEMPSCGFTSTGEVDRGTADSAYDEDGMTFEEAYKAGEAVQHQGNYYYVYRPPQDYCSADSTPIAAGPAYQIVKDLRAAFSARN